MSKVRGRKARLAAFIEVVWNRGDVAAVPDYLAAANTIHHDPGDPWEGRTLDHAGGFAKRLLQSRAPFPDQRFTVLRMAEDEDAVIMTWTWEATHLGDFPGFRATGRTIRMSGATAYGFDNEDRVNGHWQIADRLGVFQQLQVDRSQSRFSRKIRSTDTTAPRDATSSKCLKGTSIRKSDCTASPIAHAGATIPSRTDQTAIVRASGFTLGSPVRGGLSTLWSLIAS